VAAARARDGLRPSAPGIGTTLAAIQSVVSRVNRQRRELLRRGFLGMGMLATGRLWLGCGSTSALDVPLPARGGRDPSGGVAGGPPLRPRSDAGAPLQPPTRRDAGSPMVRPDASVRDAGPIDDDAGGLIDADAAEPTARPHSILTTLGPLRAPDANGLSLPAGFSSRVVARTGQLVVPGSSYLWHPAPDGGATFATLDGGYVYVSNCEASVGGGAGAIRFDAAGQIVDAYPILQNTSRNCAGGPTPWGTWLSCEEIDHGRVWECDPLGVQTAVPRPALGQFRHEAAAVDPGRMQIYLTEDEPTGRFYRFTPATFDSSGRPHLHKGRLEVAWIEKGPEGRVEWLAVDDPSGALLQTRLQVEASTPFSGAEGIWHHDGVLYFATKGDSRVWAYDLDTQLLTLIYDLLTTDRPILSGVDNVTVSPAGDVLVAEDTGGDMQIVGLAPDGTPVPLLQLVGHDGSEITGPAFDPSGTRLYFSSQRGSDFLNESGVTFEVTGEFFAPS
jgi:uncharacterized protein